MHAVDRACEALRSALVNVAGEESVDAQGYVRRLADNLVEGLPAGTLARVQAELAKGDGGELKGDRPKFFAAHSSSALAVNTFARWVGSERTLRIVGLAGFDSIEFERKYPIGLPGKAPNLDVVVREANHVVAIESKCTEFLESRTASFSDAYDGPVARLADTSWAALYEKLRADPAAFRHLDVAQLLKHYLGLKRAFTDGGVTLLYLFWEPVDWEHEPAFCQHRSELEEFAATVTDAAVRFTAQSYPELWATWSVQQDPAWLPSHVAALRRRYRVALAGREATLTAQYALGYGLAPHEEWIGEAGARLAAESIARTSREK